MKPIFFRTPAALGRWLAAHHATRGELLVEFWKRGSGEPSITWPESVDEALGVGWIDGVRKRFDDLSYTIRFAPRQARSIWSRVNIKRAGTRIENARMQPAGLAAYQARTEDRSRVYSYEQRSVDLVEPYQRMLKRSKVAWTFFEAQAPSYRRAVSWWIISAKREETRVRRLARLMAFSAQGQRRPELLSRTRSR